MIQSKFDTYVRTKVIAVTLAAVVIAATPITLHANGHDDASRLSTSIDTFQNQFSNGNYRGMMENLPPRLIAAVVAQTGQDRNAALSALAAQTETMMDEFKVILIDMDVDNSTVMKASAGLSYALIPTVTVLESADGTRVQTNSTTLGLAEGGVWTLSRIASPQQENAMKTLYPEIADVPIPSMSQKAVN